MLLRKWMKKKRIPQNRVSLQKTLCTRLLSLIKKKKMKEVEKLLSSLIKKGWEPWNRKADFCEYRFWKIRFIKESGEIVGLYTIRSLVSIESGFWQFVCQNKLLSDKVDLQDYLEDSYWFRRCPFDANWMYRIMQSALYSEEDLAKFLVENIKVD